MALQAGFGIQDFTPQEPPDGAFQVYDPISYRALILRNGKTNITFLSGDCFSIESDLMQRVRQRLKDIQWLDLNHILPCASHVGTTPILLSGPTADVGYLSTPQAHREGGMEPKYAGLAVESEALIRAAACELVQA